MKNVFGFLEEAPASGEVQFPTLSGTLYDFWRSDRGATIKAGSEVAEWLGQANGNILISGSTGGPTVSGSNSEFDSKDTLTFDGQTSGMGKELGQINGNDTGSINMMIYGAPHPAVHSSNFGAIFGYSTDGNTPLTSELVMRGTSFTQIELYGYPPGATNSSNDDTYGKGAYFLTGGRPEGLGQDDFGKFANKNPFTSTNASHAYIPDYTNPRIPFMIGAYNALNSADLFGKVDIAGCAIWTNSTNFQDDCAAIEEYFQTIFGT